MKKFLFTILTLCVGQVAFSNNMRVTNVQRSTDVARDKIIFNVAWDNTWMVGGTPGNHDAAWVFIKFRPCGGGGAWVHGLLSTTMSNHTIGASLVAATPISLNNKQGNLPAGATESNGTGNNTGLMVRRAALGVGNISEAITLQLANGAVAFDPTLEYDIRVFAIEMVQVISGGFTAGDIGTSVVAATPMFTSQNIGSEAAISAGALYTASSLLPAAYPKGFDEFYCMKYEISQGQYAHFQETINNAIPSSPSLNSTNRNTLTGTGATVGDRAQNYLCWDALLAYLDWAALRPMSELEFEKACRGPLGNGGEFAWGNTTIIPARVIGNNPEDGTDTVSTLNANAHFFEMICASVVPPGGANTTNSSVFPNHTSLSYPSYYVNSIAYNASTIANAMPFNKITAASNQIARTAPLLYADINTTAYTVVGFGPLSVGIFARDATQSRVTTGGSYYGAMEMSGNVSEQCVSVATTGYLGTWGNGLIGASGQADVPDWTGTGGAGYTNHAVRGGGYGSAKNQLRISDRSYAETTVGAAERRGPARVSGASPYNYAAAQTASEGDVGGRGVR